MKQKIFAVLLITAIVVPVEAARVRVRRGPAGRTHVTVTAGFPIRRTLPTVVVRPAPVVRIAPRVYLSPVVFTPTVVAVPSNVDVWRASEALEREDGWTDFTMNVDRRGDRMFLQVDRGAAQISFAEVVFENGEAQVVDFNDRTLGKGTYSLVNFRDGRKIDHVRVVAKATSRETELTLHLTT